MRGKTLSRPAIGKTIPAKFAGRCPVSGARYSVGDSITYARYDGGEGWILTANVPADKQQKGPEVPALDTPTEDKGDIAPYYKYFANYPDMPHLSSLPGHICKEGEYSYFSFDSFTHLFADLSKTVSFARWQKCPSRDVSRGDWSGTKTLQEAIALVFGGWQEGARRAKETCALISSEIHARGLMRKTWKRRICDEGDEYSTDRVLSGDSDYCYRDERTKTLKGNQAITLYVDTSVTAGASTDAMIARGIAIMALVELLEGLGIRCTVYAFYSAQQRRTEGDILTRVKVKDAGDVLDTERLVFSIAHPSFLRRIAFMVSEHSTREKGISLETTGLIGAPLHDNAYIPEAWQVGHPEGALLIGVDTHNLDAYTNQEYAVNWIASCLEYLKDKEGTVPRYVKPFFTE